MPGTNTMSGLRVASLVVLIAGGALTSRAAYMRAKAGLARVLIRHAWAEQVRRTGAAVKPWSGADMYPVARLRIPRIGYDEYVLDNAAPRTLAFGPGVVGNGAVVGGGNLAIAGHRTSWFLPLRNVAVGDRIELEWFDAKSGRTTEKEYVVERIEVIEPSDVRLLNQADEDALTLVTCYPFGYGASSPQRYVVRAVPAAQNARLENREREER